MGRLTDDMTRLVADIREARRAMQGLERATLDMNRLVADLQGACADGTAGTLAARIEPPAHAFGGPGDPVTGGPAEIRRRNGAHDCAPGDDEGTRMPRVRAGSAGAR